MLIPRSEIFARIEAELDRAYQKHGRPVWGRHEFYGITAEEFDEVWEAIKHDLPQEELVKEIIQVAAMCVRYLETGDRYRDAEIPKIVSRHSDMAVGKEGK